MEETISRIATIFDILSNEVRLCIILNLFKGEEKRVSELQHCAKVSQSVISQQLSKLKSLGIINFRKVGNEVYYSLNDGNIKNIIARLNVDELSNE